MNKIIILPLTKNDIRESAKWYNKAKKGLGIEFIEEIDLLISIIQTNPLSFAIKYENVRLALINRFPYMIHYEYLENENTIFIKAIFHTSRNPTIWEDRK